VGGSWARGQPAVGGPTGSSGEPAASERRVLASEEDAVTQTIEDTSAAVVTILNEKTPTQDAQGNIVQGCPWGRA
jgi:hypothetical protein